MGGTYSVDFDWTASINSIPSALGQNPIQHDSVDLTGIHHASRRDKLRYADDLDVIAGQEIANIGGCELRFRR